MEHLPEEPRLADTRLADDRYHLAASQVRALERVAQLLQLRVPADETREPAPRGDLEARARDGSPRQLEHVDRIGEPLDRHGSKRRDLHEALGQLQRLCG